jgi:hypothetical protein
VQISSLPTSVSSLLRNMRTAMAVHDDERARRSVLADTRSDRRFCVIGWLPGPER